MYGPMFLVFAVALAQTPESPPFPGQVIELREHTALVIPEHYEPRADGVVDVLFHFHLGQRWVTEELRAAKVNAVLIHFSPGGLSSKYAEPFRDEALFATILNEALTALQAEASISDDARWGKLNVSSFSAGFGAVRELLKKPEYVERIDGILMVDSLYAGYEGDPAERVVAGRNMVGFRAYADRAAAGEKVLVITHTYIQPPGYAGTHETADDLIAHVGVESRSVRESGPGELVIDRRAGRGGFHVFGTEGDTGPHHVQHLRQMGHWLPLLRWTGDASRGDEGQR